MKYIFFVMLIAPHIIYAVKMINEKELIRNFYGYTVMMKEKLNAPHYSLKQRLVMAFNTLEEWHELLDIVGNESVVFTPVMQRQFKASGDIIEQQLKEHVSAHINLLE